VIALLARLALYIVEFASALTLLFLAFGWALRHVGDALLSLALDIADLRAKIRSVNKADRTRTNRAGTWTVGPIRIEGLIELQVLRIPRRNHPCSTIFLVVREGPRPVANERYVRAVHEATHALMFDGKGAKVIDASLRIVDAKEVIDGQCCTVTGYTTR